LFSKEWILVTSLSHSSLVLTKFLESWILWLSVLWSVSITRDLCIFNKSRCLLVKNTLTKLSTVCLVFRILLTSRQSLIKSSLFYSSLVIFWSCWPRKHLQRDNWTSDCLRVRLSLILLINWEKISCMIWRLILLWVDKISSYWLFEGLWRYWLVDLRLYLLDYLSW